MIRSSRLQRGYLHRPTVGLAPTAPSLKRIKNRLLLREDSIILTQIFVNVNTKYLLVILLVVSCREPFTVEMGGLGKSDYSRVGVSVIVAEFYDGHTGGADVKVRGEVGVRDTEDTGEEG